MNEKGEGTIAKRRAADRVDPAGADGIGARLSVLRTERGMKIAELAREIGVSTSLISQIEKGTSKPSVATLFALSQALEVPVDAFFTDRPASSTPPATDDEERASRADPISAGGHHPDRYLLRKGNRPRVQIEGGVVWERLTPQPLDSLEFLELIYEPGAQSNGNLYRHPGYEMVVVTEGRLQIIVAFDTYDLKEGDSISFPSSMPHRYVNPYDSKAKAITVILHDRLEQFQGLT